MKFRNGGCCGISQRWRVLECCSIPARQPPTQTDTGDKESNPALGGWDVAGAIESRSSSEIAELCKGIL